MRSANVTADHRGRTALPRPAALLPLLLAFLLLPLPAPAATQAQGIQARSAILMDLGSGRILYEQNADEPIPPASLTKVMSMYVIFDAVKKGRVTLSDQVTVSQTAAGTGGSRMHLKKREQLSLDKILTGMAVSSGNDASMAAAEYVAGDVKSFVAAMNAKAAAIGMGNTVFMNPTGLPAQGHITTARDMLTMARAYLRTYPDALDYHSQKTLVHNKVRTRNHNPLLNSCPGADGLKSGWVVASGYNLITTAKRDGARLVGVILGAATPGVRARENLRLMEAGFAALRDNTSVAEALPAAPVPEYRRAPGKKAKTSVAAAETRQAKRGKSSKAQAAKAPKAEVKPAAKRAVATAKAAPKAAQVAAAPAQDGKRVSVEYASPKMRVTRTTDTAARAATDATAEAAKTAQKAAVRKAKAKDVKTAEAKTSKTGDAPAKKRKAKAKKPEAQAKAKTRSGDS